MPYFDFLNSSAAGNVSFPELMGRFGFNMVMILFIIHFLYYRKSRRSDYYFTFTLISLSIFLMISLLSSINMEIGFALGLFAIFGIIRYRTESMPVREMTYLFAIISLSVINALATTFSYLELGICNLFFVFAIWLIESNHWLEHVGNKLVLYDRIDLIVPERRDEMIEDLKARTGLNIIKVEVGHIDFIRDSAMVNVFYKPSNNQINPTDSIVKFPKQGE